MVRMKPCFGECPVVHAFAICISNQEPEVLTDHCRASYGALQLLRKPLCSIQQPCRVSNYLLTLQT